MPEAYSIGKFTPSRLQSEIIEAEIKKHLPDCCRCERVGVRPSDGQVVHPDNMEWHQDGGGPIGITRHMIVWSTETPTEIKSSEGEVFSFEPFDLVWFDNFKAFHRQPRNTRPNHRWFLAVRCSGQIF